MMHRYRSRSSFLRAMLAVSLLLATLAGARLQGQMAVMAAQTADLGLLCTGERLPDNGSGGQHGHCMLCNLPLSEPPAAPIHAGPSSRVAAVDIEAGVAYSRLDPAAAYRSRAPPFAS